MKFWNFPNLALTVFEEKQSMIDSRQEKNSTSDSEVCNPTVKYHLWVMVLAYFIQGIENVGLFGVLNKSQLRVSNEF